MRGAAQGYGGAAVLLASAIYYSLYLRSGFGYTDDGSFAQICYELLNGRAPQDMALGYGILWFKLGEALFSIFGVSFTVVKLFFFACIALTNVLLFDALSRLTRDWRIAAIITLVILLVPAFPATSFYGLCVMLNVAAQARMIARDGGATRLDAGLAGAALALSFQIRPDFGYVFAAALIVLLGLVHRSAPQRTRELATAAGTGFVAASLPLTVAALAGGYGGLLLHQYLDYPRLMIGALLNGVSGSQGGPGLGAGLARPRASWIFSAEADHRAAAIPVYLPVVGMAAFAVFTLTKLRRDFIARNDKALGAAVIGLTAALAAFPHYFLFRPDLPHVANFMPGYAVMIGVFLRQVLDSSVSLPRYAVPGFIAVHLALYAWIGLGSEVTGSIGLAKGRDVRFTARNGVDVRVAPTENELLTRVRDAIEQNSQPGEPIVCLPYCPGFAFMTSRRMLLRNFYIDDGILATEPDWLERTIAQTKTSRPKVVLVSDWAVNGTENSRFTVWAAAYVDAVKAMARDSVVLPGGFTAYFVDPQTANP